MTALPGKPFGTENFSLRGGGIDFLGLRWVNLTIVGRDLLPELNNVTTDMGTFFLGGWIPWKFRQLCTSEKDYTEKNYKLFREKAEVALSLTFRDELNIPRDCGVTRNRVGITQKCSLPAKLSFKEAKRTDQNSLYAAAIYGPALGALGFIKAYHSQAKQGAKPLNIPVPGDDPETVRLMKGVDESLRRTKSYSMLATLDSTEFKETDIRKLAEAGLDPARYRSRSYSSLKECFRRKLLPGPSADDISFRRTLTTRLVIATLKQRDAMTAQELRDTWYTRMLPNGKKFQSTDPVHADHAQRWSCFMARQYQRYAIELFLWCFEDAIGHGSRSIENVIDHWTKRTHAAGQNLKGTFATIAAEHAGPLSKGDEEMISRAWNQNVHSEHQLFEYVHEPQDDNAVIHGLRMLAGWYWRMLVRQYDEKAKPLMMLGGADRMSMTWFLQWLCDRKNRPLSDLLRDIFSDLIFSQHMRVALARFDGSAQRLRFLVGDGGIEPTESARSDIGNLRLPWMPDRLDTVAGLLCDCDVLVENDDQTFSLGPSAATVEHSKPTDRVFG